MTQRRPSPSGDNFHVRLPSGRPLAIREWMTQPESATYAVCDRPRLTREAFSDLRMIVDSVLCILAEDGANDDAPRADDTTETAVRTEWTQPRSGGRPQDRTAGSPGSPTPGGGDEPGAKRRRRP